MLGGRQSPLLRLASAFETWISMKSISCIFDVVNMLMPSHRGHRLKQRWNNVPSQSVDKLCVDMWKYTLVSKIHNYTHKDKHVEHKTGKLMACAWGERGFDTKSASIFSGWQPLVASAFMPHACTWPAFCQKVIFLNFRSFWHSPLVPAPPLWMGLYCFSDVPRYL